MQASTRPDIRSGNPSRIFGAPNLSFGRMKNKIGFTDVASKCAGGWDSMVQFAAERLSSDHCPGKRAHLGSHEATRANRPESVHGWIIVVVILLFAGNEFANPYLCDGLVEPHQTYLAAQASRRGLPRVRSFAVRSGPGVLGGKVPTMFIAYVISSPRRRKMA